MKELLDMAFRSFLGTCLDPSIPHTGLMMD
jgi:hypothetical protein